ncbi:transcription termination/antitermination protein NusA [Candidatus Saccharibacteria bacterium]|nr:transcription termination/antitermination protein NusA [Candidatus Saccharibacteria bacterium]
MNNQFVLAIEQICEEKGISKDMVIEAIEAALAAAYKKDFGDRDQEVRVVLDSGSGAMRIFVTKEVAKEVENDHLQISLDEAKKVDSDAKLEGTVEIEVDDKDFGRVAAQTAKQVIVQRIREAERDVIFNEFEDKEGTIINTVVQRAENGNVYVDLGRAVGIMFPNDQIDSEKYYPGQRIKVYVVRVEQTQKGPQIVVSRTHPDMIRKLFEMEVPEIAAGTVEIAGIAREAGMRTKIAVKSNAEGVDPVGTFVGGRGTRVQAVMADLGEEKIDIIAYSEDPAVYITNALSPTKVISVKTDDDSKKALVKVPEDQLSLAIGKAGQNVRLAAKLTGWNVDIDGADEAGVEATAEATEDQDQPKPKRTGDLEESLIASLAGDEKDKAAEEPKETTEDKTSAKSDKAEEKAEKTDKPKTTEEK